MKSEQLTSCTCCPQKIAAISGKRIDLNEIEQILVSHESVHTAELTVVMGDKGINLLHAQVQLAEDTTPANELKLDLAWHVGAESGNFSVFKDIEFSETESDDAEEGEEISPQSGIVHISGHRISTMEVEQALLSFDGVVKAKIIGVPDARKGEILKAFITLKEGMVVHHDLKTDLAWHARIEVSPVIVFRDIVFGQVPELSYKKNIAESLKVDGHSERLLPADLK